MLLLRMVSAVPNRNGFIHLLGATSSRFDRNELLRLFGFCVVWSTVVVGDLGPIESWSICWKLVSCDEPSRSKWTVRRLNR